MNNFELAKTYFLEGLNNFQDGDHLSAEEKFRESLKYVPDRVSTLTNLAATLIVRRELDEAEELSLKAIFIDNNSAESWLNLGVIDYEQLNYSDAIKKFEKAICINPRYNEAHIHLGNTLKDLGQLNDAAASYRRALELNPTYAEVHNNLGNALNELGQIDDAIASYRRALEINPDYAEAHNNLGNALKTLGRICDAVACYRRALEIKYDIAEVHNNLGNALNQLGNIDDAISSYRQALEINPDYAEAHNNLGNVLKDLGQLDDAESSYCRALEIKHDYALAHSNLGTLYMEQGKLDEAESSLNKGLELAPGDAKTLATALFYIPYQQNDPRFHQLETTYSRRELLPLEERIKLAFAMGKVMEDIGQYDRSFSAYEEGNRLHYQLHPYDDAEDGDFLNDSCNIFTSELFMKSADIINSLPAIQDERVPIFIVGMPRTGSTLIEQILASHPDIYGAGEITTLDLLARKTEGLSLDLPNLKATLLTLRKLGQEYIDQIWKLAPSTRYITDKMISNYRHLGLIQLMLPHAKIIHAKRDPMDTCFSCYALKFSHGHEYSYDLKVLGRAYQRYMKFMQHWDNILPFGQVLGVRYEDIIADHEYEARRILDYLGLPWNTACLRFYESKRTVRTASVTQVRKPIYSSSVARWKHFEKRLGPLLEIIHPAKNKYPIYE